MLSLPNAGSTLAERLSLYCKFFDVRVMKRELRHFSLKLDLLFICYKIKNTQNAMGQLNKFNFLGLIAMHCVRHAFT
jgi:hypothetical protein